MSKQRIFKLVYIIILILFTIFVLVDTFLIPKRKAKIAKQERIEEIEEYITERLSTNTSYKDDDININIETIVRNESNVYVADIQLSDIKYLKAAFAKDEYGRNIKENTSTIAQNNNAILAINGDYYGFRDYGYVLRNGVVYRDERNSDKKQQDLVIYTDGRFEIVYENDVDINDLKNRGAWQVFSFGPGLIINGEITVDKDQEVAISSPSNPRTAIGIIDDKHYVFVVSDGRTDVSKGLSLMQLAECMKELGCKQAYNLDGGGSTTMYFDGTVMNVTTSGSKIEERRVSDILYIGRQ